MEIEIGQKIRIIKCFYPMITIDLLGKVDHIKNIHDNGIISLEKYNINVFSELIEVVSETDFDINLQINEKTLYNPEKTFIKHVTL